MTISNLTDTSASLAMNEQRSVQLNQPDKPTGINKQAGLGSDEAIASLAQTAHPKDNKLSEHQSPATEQSAKQETSDALASSLQQLSDSVGKLNALQDRKLEFSIEQESGRSIVKVLDKEKDQVIRQIPSQEFIQMSERITELTDELHNAQGLLFDSKA